MRCTDLQGMDDARKDSRNAAPDAQRKEFEAWAKSEKMLIEKSRGKYVWDTTAAAWRAWQARGAKKVKLPEKYLPLYDPDTSAIMEKSEHGLWLDEDDVRDAIRAAGYEVE